MEKIILLEFNDIKKATIIFRPSKVSRTPYVADINIQDDDEIYQGHCPSLGCCGLCEKSSEVYVYTIVGGKGSVCKYKVFLSNYIETSKNKSIYIGIEPKMAESIVENAIIKNCFNDLKYVKCYKREVKIKSCNSRFDFIGIDNNDKTFILEVKNVPLADYEDITKKEKLKKNYDNRDFNSKIAYFPDGYRRNNSDVVSERALKHINELYNIKKCDQNIRCIICYVIQRDDISSFQPSNLDIIYKNAFINAVNNGIEVFTLVCSWNINNNNNAQCIFVNDKIKINY